MVVGAEREFGSCLNMQAVSNRGVLETPKRTKKVRVEFPKWTEHLFLDLISFSLTLAPSKSLHGYLVGRPLELDQDIKFCCKVIATEIIQY